MFCCSAAFFGSLSELIRRRKRTAGRANIGIKRRGGAAFARIRPKRVQKHAKKRQKRGQISVCGGLYKQKINTLRIRPKHVQTKKRTARLFRALPGVDTTHAAGQNTRPRPRFLLSIICAGLLLPYGGRVVEAFGLSALLWIWTTGAGEYRHTGAARPLSLSVLSTLSIFAGAYGIGGALPYGRGFCLCVYIVHVRPRRWCCISCSCLYRLHTAGASVLHTPGRVSSC